MSLKILICDDAGFIREILSHAVLALGHQVAGEARDGVEAVIEAKRLRPDVILLDLVMPLKNGSEAAREIKEALPQTRIVAISTTDEGFLKRKAQEVGCDAWMTKPFTRTQLKNVLQSFVVTDQEAKNG